jgi:hypothetical protein
MFPTRQNGIARQRGKLWSTETQEGDLEIVEVRQTDLNRTVKVARLTTIFNTFELLEAQILWIADDKMCFSGFERCNRGENIVDFAQSWVCTILNQRPFRKRDPTH